MQEPSKLRIIYEDKYILVMHKAAGVATQTKKLSEMDVLSYVKNYLDGGYVGIINRLDRQVEGLVLLAKSSGMAAKLTEQLNQHKIEKNYCARVYIDKSNSGVLSDSFVTLEDYIFTDKLSNTSRICDATVNDAKLARLEYKMTDMDIKDGFDIADLDIRLITGRHHQIRVQLSHAGMPILGDMKYGSEASVKYSEDNDISVINLKAYRLKFVHPATGVDMTFTI